jgi:hypothetical protein
MPSQQLHDESNTGAMSDEIDRIIDILIWQQKGKK